MTWLQGRGTLLRKMDALYMVCGISGNLLRFIDIICFLLFMIFSGSTIAPNSVPKCQQRSNNKIKQESPTEMRQIKKNVKLLLKKEQEFNLRLGNSHSLYNSVKDKYLEQFFRRNSRKTILVGLTKSKTNSSNSNYATIQINNK